MTKRQKMKALALNEIYRQNELKETDGGNMTVAELHKILDNENRKITLKEYQEILYQFKWDIQDEIYKLTEEDITHPKLKWYNGEMNGFQIALDLSEHIKEE